MQHGLKCFIPGHLNQRLTAILSLPILPVLIIGFGTVVRLVQYFANRSLWADEATLALNIVNRSYLQLLQPLDYNQVAPIGFLLVERLAVQQLGDSEYALRLFPLLCGITSLVLFYKLAKRCLPTSGIAIALGFFATLPYLVYFSTEVKQYSSDVAIALLLSLLLTHWRNEPLSRQQVMVLAAVGAIAIWFSHPAILVLAAIELCYGLIGLLSQKKLPSLRRIIVYVIWIVSFLFFYFISIRSVSRDPELLQSWGKAFPSSPFDIIWALDGLGKFFYRPMGFSKIIDGVAIVAFIVGCISLYLRKRETFWFVLSPFLVTLLTAYLHKYPFRSRLLLFLVPFAILPMTEGIEWIRSRARFKFAPVAGVLLAVVLLYSPVVEASNLLVKPELREEIKPVLSYVRTHQQPGDVLYIYQRGKYQFQYYANKFGYRPGDYIIGVDDLDQYDGKTLSSAEKQRYQNDLNNLRGNRRVWLLFSHATVRRENEWIRAYLDHIGTQIDSFSSYGAFVYLYDLSRDRTQESPPQSFSF